MPIKYCNQCGAPTVIKIPHGDNLPRAVCEGCGFIQYENPRVIVGCIAEWEDKILLCKRAIEPRLGYWTLPAGFLENNETSQAPFSLIDIPHINQIYLLYRAQLANASFSTTFESSEVALFNETTLPWDEIAFAAIKKSLEHYFDDKRKDIFTLHVETISVSTQKK